MTTLGRRIGIVGSMCVVTAALVIAPAAQPATPPDMILVNVTCTMPAADPEWTCPGRVRSAMCLRRSMHV